MAHNQCVDQRKIQQTRTYPRYAELQIRIDYESISFINKWLSVWDTFQEYAGVFLEYTVLKFCE